MVSEAFLLISELAAALGETPLNAHEGCWEVQIGKWEIAANAHREPHKCSTGATVDPYSAYVRFHGWPAGVLWPTGGVITTGDGASEDDLIDALKTGIAKQARIPMEKS